MADAVERTRPHPNPTRIGSYKASLVGNGFKTSIPNEIAAKWNFFENFTEKQLNEEGRTKIKLKQGVTEIPVYLYAEKREGKIVLILSKEPLEFDILG